MLQQFVKDNRQDKYLTRGTACSCYKIVSAPSKDSNKQIQIYVVGTHQKHLRCPTEDALDSSLPTESNARTLIKLRELAS